MKIKVTETATSKLLTTIRNAAASERAAFEIGDYFAAGKARSARERAEREYATACAKHAS